ncbi:MAG TPA: PAS domain S-box protein [bacterium]|nr:PAS domain S-box protein [bacterium]
MTKLSKIFSPVLSSLFENLQDSVSVLENGVFTECNYATLKMMGMKDRDEILGKTPWDLSPEFQPDKMSSKEKAGKYLKECLEKGNARFEWCHTRPDGTQFFAEILLTRVPGSNDDKVFVLWRDVSEKVNARKAVTEIENRFREVTESAPTAILVHKDGKWLYANKAASEIFNLQPSDIIGENFLKYIRPDHVAKASEFARKRLAGEPVPDRYEICILTKEGTEKWIDVKVNVTEFNGEKAVIVNAIDITKRIEAEKSLRESNEKLRTTLNSIGDGVISTDASGKVMMINPVAEKMTGWTVSDAAGQPLEKVFNIVNAFSREKVDNPVSKVLKEGGVVGLANHTVLLNRSGREFQIADSGAPIMDDSGKVKGVVLVFRDVTEKYILEEQLKQTQKMEAIGQLASGLAHDFGNMITGIVGSAELLGAAMKGDPEASGHVERIKEASMQAFNMTRRLLDFSRKSKGELVEFDVNELILKTIDLASPGINNRKIKIIKDFKVSSSRVKGDPDQLQNALINLIFNARDAMPEGGRLEFSTSEHFIPEHTVNPMFLSPGNYIKISVTDTGSGISEDIQDRVFEPFFTTKKPGTGTGLGLTSVFKALKDHNGTVVLHSKPGEGARFDLFIPAKITGS